MPSELELISARIERAESILVRLDSGAPLSTVLMGVKRLADDDGDVAASSWLELEIKGLSIGESKPTAGEEQKQGVLKFSDVRAMINPEEVTRDAINRGANSLNTARDRVMLESVADIERVIPENDAVLADLDEKVRSGFLEPRNQDRVLQMHAHNRERKRLLNQIRGEVYDYVGGLIRKLSTEQSGVELVGAEYRVIVDRLDVLDTSLGDELRSALRLASSLNPADWNACALMCRNVILKLGRILWPNNTGTYYSSLLNRELDLKGDREFNRLSAYMDVKFKELEPKDSQEITQLLGLSKEIYEQGSSGKNQVRREKAQDLVVKTFDFVSRLQSLTALKPY